MTSPTALPQARRRRRNPVPLVLGGLALALLLGFILFGNLSKSLEYFVTPTEYRQDSAQYQGRTVRLGGLVRHAEYDRQTLNLRFTITDYGASYPVTYQGAVSDLFKENQGVVVRGQFQNGVFHANELLVKHSEEYRVPQSQADIKSMLKDTQ
ncbi:cytochrome c maturation protein CcmE [Deinococcus sonorensis]|uniref:Cytochrome c-type biogenesis protein CcmE n=2 Tax=Deinococcus sonorensis TaxID=309891 RepID=A0AAU7UF68_9DEIO